MAFDVKLDTNGYRPDILQYLVNNGLVDFVAMDIKNSPSKYELTSGCSRNLLENITERINILKQNLIHIRKGNLKYIFLVTKMIINTLMTYVKIYLNTVTVLFGILIMN